MKNPFSPHLHQRTKDHTQYAVRQLTLSGWRLLDLYDYEHYQKPPRRSYWWVERRYQERWCWTRNLAVANQALKHIRLDT